MNWHLTASESHTLTRSKALEFAARHAGLPHSPVEREVEPARVKKLVAVIRSGLVLPFNWAVAQYEGKTVRMNGQHSGAAILEVGAEIPDKLTFHMDSYVAENRHGMVELFRQFDQRWSSRTTQDICGAYQGLIPELVDCDRRIMKVAAEGVSWCKRSVLGEAAPSGDDTYDLLHSPVYTSFFQWVDGHVNGRKELKKKEVMAAMFQTHEVSQSGASKFWREVSLGPDFFSDDMAPGAVLISELNRALEDKEYRDKEFLTAFYYKKAIKAWNAFCANQRISSLKVTKSKKGQPSWPDVSHYGASNEVAA